MYYYFLLYSLNNSYIPLIITDSMMMHIATNAISGKQIINPIIKRSNSIIVNANDALIH